MFRWFRRKPRPSKTHVLAEMGGMVFVVKHRAPVLLPIGRWEPAMKVSIIDMKSDPSKQFASVRVVGELRHPGLNDLIAAKRDSLQVWTNGSLMMDVTIVEVSYTYSTHEFTVRAYEDRSEW